MNQTKTYRESSLCPNKKRSFQEQVEKRQWKIFLLNMARHTNNYGKTEV